MKKILMLALILLVLGSCSTYYGKYDYDRYFQNNEPYITVDSEEEASEFIARKLARQFRRGPRETLSVLSFTDEYGDRINRGDFFSRMVIAEMTRYNNPVVVERESLYELIKERELSMTNLIDNEGYRLGQLMQADYILHGRILRGKYEDMISVRCFEVGTGQVVYAATVSIDYVPEYSLPVPSAPEPPVIIITDPHHPGPGTGSDDPEGPDVIKKPEPDNNKDTDSKKRPADGTQSEGKINLDNQKKDPSSNSHYKKKEVYTPPNEKAATKKKTTTVKKRSAVKKSVPVKTTSTKEQEVEKKEENSKKSSSSTKTKKSSSIEK